MKANGGKEVVPNFKAKIREGAKLVSYMKADKAEVRIRLLTQLASLTNQL